MLCQCPRLLQESVQLGIELNDSEVNLDEHELIPIIKANKALKVKRLTVDCDIFAGENALKLETVINFIREHGIHNMVEVLTFSVIEEYNCVEILFEFLSVLSRPKTLRLITSHLDAKSDKYIVFDDRWHNSKFSTINCIKLETWGIDDNQLWTSTFSLFLTSIIGTMPNIKSIIDIQGYNEEFYEKYAHAIEIERLNIHDVAKKIVRTKNLKLKDVKLFGDSDYSADEFWRVLNRFHSEIKSLHLSYNTKGAPVPIHDYSKVTHLDLTHSFGDASEGDLGSILITFPSIKNLYFSGSVTKACFFGHNFVELNQLTTAKIYLEEDCKLTCNECIEAYIKSFKNVEDFNIDLVSLTLLKSISKSMEKLKTLSFSTSPDTTMFCEWPEMLSLEHLIFRYGLDSISIKDIQTIYKMCPKMQSLEFSDNVSIKN